MTTAERLTAVAENVKKVYEAGYNDGFQPPEGEELTPEWVYRNTRPKDWLPMPHPGDNEMYLLGQILPNKKGYFYVLLTFSGTCSIEIGTIVNGSFVPKASYTPTSGTSFSCVVEYADYGDEISDGTRQYMVRISGSSVQQVRFNYKELSVPMPQIVDVVCGIPLNRFTAANYNDSKETLQALQYLRFVGKGRPGWIHNNAFVGGCKNLKCVLCEAKNNSSYTSYSFYGCSRLLAASFENLCAGVTDSMTLLCESTDIATASFGDIKPKTITNTFSSSGLRKFTAKTLDTSEATDMYRLFNQCYSLSSVTGLNISSVTNVNQMFQSCEALARLTFAGETTPGGWTISLTASSLDHDALVEMITSLPVATAAPTITITGNPGASELTDAEIAVATAKNWTITR